MLDAYVRDQPHFLDHLAHIWKALPSRGRFIVGNEAMAQRAERLGVDVTVVDTRAWKPRQTTMIAGAGDFLKTVPMVLVEHGAGQTWPGRSKSYPGGKGREMVALFICPSERVAELNRKWYPDAAYAVVGCPKMDPWVGRTWERSVKPVVALSFHWRNSAWANYIKGFATIREKAPFDLIGHGHPRIQSRYRWRFRRAGIPFVDDFDDVLARADLYACDNSSTIYEFALTGRPVVLLDAPWYKRGSLPLRFGEAWDIGLHATGPKDIIPTIVEALTDPPDVRQRRESILDGIYAVRDGTSAQRAADAITAWLARDMKAAA